MKTRELLTEWLYTYEKDRVKSRTYSRYEGLITLHILPELGEIEITELCRRQIQDFLTRKKKDGNRKQDGASLSSASTNLTLRSLMSKKSDKYYFASSEEIKSLGVEKKKKLKDFIADHTEKILQETEVELENTNTATATFSIDL